MPVKHPAWTRVRIGRDRVLWVAYDDRTDLENRVEVARGYATSLPEADSAARSALAEAGMYQARRIASGLGASRHAAKAKASQSPRLDDSRQSRPREYVFTRRLGNADDDGIVVAAHLILRKTAKKVYATVRCCGPDQIGTEDERWDPDEQAIALDRIKLERDGSVYSSRYRLSDFFASREQAMGDSPQSGQNAFQVLGIQAPATLDDIKSAYRVKALEVHPDRGGSQSEFHEVEAAYRQLLREAQVWES
jgi:hypothetical protein